jgi:hypothetical protein
MVDNATKIELQLTYFVEQLALFFNIREDIERGLILLQEFNKIAGICTNPLKNVYCPINCMNPSDVIINNVAILPPNKRTKQRLLGSFFSPALEIHNSCIRQPPFSKKALRFSTTR